MELNTRLIALVGVAAAAVLFVTAGVMAIARPTAEIPGTGAAESPRAPAILEPGDAPLGDARMASFRDHAISVEVPAAPTADKSQSKLWFAHGSWWGILLAADGGTANVHRLDWDTQEWEDTGVVIDERIFARADVVAEDEHVYITTAGRSPFRTHAVRLLRLTWDAETSAYGIDEGFPVEVADRGAGSVVVARASGTTWVGWIRSGDLSIARSTDDVTWETLPSPVAADKGASRVALVEASGALQLIWADADDAAVFIARHPIDGADGWSEPQALVDGDYSADDHLSTAVATVDGTERLYVTIKTSLDEAPGTNPNAPQILLVEVHPDGSIVRHLVSRIRDGHTRPLVVIDQEAGRILVAAAAPSGGGRIYYKASPLDAIAFPVGRGSPIVRSNEDVLLNDATSTKQHVNSESGFVVLGWDAQTRRYVHGTLDLGGPQWSARSRLGDPAAAPSPDGGGSGDGLPEEPVPVEDAAPSGETPASPAP